ncbi:MAG: hypothetical protein ABJ387_03670 [Balneola sp.]
MRDQLRIENEELGIPNELISTHKLDFNVTDWLPHSEFKEFIIGTVRGLWKAEKNWYVILSITNTEPGNGHLEDVFEWFYHSCNRDNKGLKVIEIINERFGYHLVKRGFTFFGDMAFKYAETIRSEMNEVSHAE